MRYTLMIYGKDRDIYDQITESNDKDELIAIANLLVEFVRCGRIVDDQKEPYDWLEIWDEEDDNRANDICFH